MILLVTGPARLPCTLALPTPVPCRGMQGWWPVGSAALATVLTAYREAGGGTHG